MKKSVFILALFLLASLGIGMTQEVVAARFRSSAGGGITPRGTPVCGISATPLTISYTAYAASDTLVVGANGLYGVLGTATVTDNKSDTFTQIVTPSSYSSAIYANLAISSGVTSVTITTTGGDGAVAACISEYSGGVRFGNTSNSTTWSGTSYTASLTMQGANNYIIIVANDNTYGQNPVPTATAGTVRVYNNGNANGSMWLQDNTSASSGTLAASGTTSPSSVGWIVAAELRSQ